MKKNIIMFSGGKDSTAMLLMMIEKKYHIDEIRYFDCGDWEFPEMKLHIDKLEKNIKIPIKRMKYKFELSDMFLKYGFPSFVRRWCTARKVQTLNKGIKKEDNVYIGYAFDEQQRIFKRKTKNKFKEIYPLIERGITEKQALEYCIIKGYDWSGLYNIFKRVSCWLCPLQPISELQKLWKHYPKLWKKLIKMQKKLFKIKENGYYTFDNKSVMDLERMFKKQDKQLLMF